MYTRAMLEDNHGFFAWDSDDVSHFHSLGNYYREWMAHCSRSDGHGGTKGGPEFKVWLRQKYGVEISKDFKPITKQYYSIDEEDLTELLKAVLNLGMDVREKQLNGSTDKSRNDFLEEFMQFELHEYININE